MKLLTWNIQAGIGTGSYRDYLLRAHRQVVHTAAKANILQQIAQTIAGYDVVGLQEVDLGGRRAGYKCQASELAAVAGFAHVEIQENRTVRGVSRHGNAILSRWPLAEARDLKLPGRMRGRGCLVVRVMGPKSLTIANLHLSLGARDQAEQLAFVAKHLKGRGQWIVMGDFNCQVHSGPLDTFCEAIGGQVPRPAPATFPSWQPRRDYDHIIPHPQLKFTHYARLGVIQSDHLPVEAVLDT